MADHADKADMLELTAQVVSAYVSNNAVEEGTLPVLIGEVFRVLTDLAHGGVTGAVAGTAAGAAASGDRPVPAVAVRRSVFPDYIVCLEDGKKLKMLKRHLKTAYDMTPDAYRQRWGLPADYPMVAPSYASHRSDLAKKIGLGRKPQDEA